MLSGYQGSIIKNFRWIQLILLVQSGKKDGPRNLGLVVKMKQNYSGAWEARHHTHRHGPQLSFRNASISVVVLLRGCYRSKSSLSSSGNASRTAGTMASGKVTIWPKTTCSSRKLLYNTLYATVISEMGQQISEQHAWEFKSNYQKIKCTHLLHSGLRGPGQRNTFTTLWPERPPVNETHLLFMGLRGPCSRSCFRESKNLSDDWSAWRRSMSGKNTWVHKPQKKFPRCSVTKIRNARASQARE